MRYRAEIDGLRALAVVPVILFHAGVGGFGGGYVGVDVFFVISGYLIGGILLDDFAKGRFSYLRFYERRARRLLPALFAVVACCLPVAWFVLLPDALDRMGESLVATGLFLSNVYFWMRSGYFATDASLLPFLHTWSLGVEEQFYILFPILLALLMRKPRLLLPVLSGLALVSLVAAEWAVHRAPEAAFFLPWFRGWELFAGVLLAARRAPPLPRRLADLVAGAGIVAILASIAVFDETTPIPGLAGLPPVLGALAILAYAGPGTWSARFLSLGPVAGMGLISYSAYLWHQPLLSYARHATGRDLSAPLAASSIVLTLILAWLTWRFVETPFRSGSVPIRRFAGLAGAGTLTVLVVGAVLDRTHGLHDLYVATLVDPQRVALYQAVRRSTANALTEEMYLAPDRPCSMFVGDPDELDPATVEACAAEHGAATVLTGDSHAINMFNLLARTGRFPFLIAVVRAGCRLHDVRPGCQYAAFDRFLTDHRAIVGTVLYHQSGSYFIEDEHGLVDTQQAFEGGFGGFGASAIDRSLEALAEMKQAHHLDLRWIGPFAEYRRSTARAAVGDPEALAMNPASRALFARLEPVISARLHAVPDAPDYVPFDALFRIPDDAMQGDCFLYWDADHFSHCGEAWLAERGTITLDPLLPATTSFDPARYDDAAAEPG